MSENVKECCNNTVEVESYIESISKGDTAIDFETLTVLGKKLFIVNARSVQAMAIVITKGREHFGRDIAGWVAWCRNEFQLHNVSYRSHLRSIGKMLIDLLDVAPTLYRRMFALSVDKLYPLSRLSVDQVKEWLTRYCPETMTREDIRDAVAAFLGEAVTQRADQPALPGFEDILDNVISIDNQTLKTAVKNGEIAKRSFVAGIGLLDAALEYHQHGDDFDPVDLHNIKKALVIGIAEIEKIIARKS